MNYPVNRSDIQIFKNVTNTVDVFIRDIDRKPVMFPSNNTPTIQIFDPKQNNILFTASMTLVDSAKGLWKFIVPPSAINDMWNIGYLQYVVCLIDTSNSNFPVTTPLHTDQGRTMAGTILLYDGPVPAPVGPTTIPFSSFIPLNNFYYSGGYRGAAQNNNPSGQHTAAIYTTGFTGSVLVQASLASQSPTEDDQWFDVTTNNFSNITATTGVTFVGNYMWVRYVVSITSGTMDQILFRN